MAQIITATGCRINRQRRKTKWRGSRKSKAARITATGCRIRRPASIDVDYLADGPDTFDFGGKKDLPMSHFLKIHDVQPNHSRSRRTYSENLEFKISHIKDSKNPGRLLERIFKTLLRRINNSPFNGPPRLVGVQLQNHLMESPFFVPLRPPTTNTPETLASALVWLNRQSGARLKLFKKPLTCRVYGVWPTDAKTKKMHGNPLKKLKRKKKRKGLKGGCSRGGGERPALKSLVHVENTDSYCLFRSVALLLAHVDKGGRKNWRLHLREKELALAIIEETGIDPALPAYGVEHLRRIQGWLNTRKPGHFRLALFDWCTLGRVVFKGPRARRDLYILHHNGHFEPLLKPEEIFKARGKFCLDCEEIGYANSHPRTCPALCRLCYRSGFQFPCKRSGGMPPIDCQKCGFQFPNVNCYKWHLKRGPRNGKPICEQRFHCAKCQNVIYARGVKHECQKVGNGQMEEEENETSLRCEKCNSAHDPSSSQCYIQPYFYTADGLPEKVKNLRFVFYDIESTQTRKILGGTSQRFKHEANLVICELICKPCMDAGILLSSEDSKNRFSEKCLCGVNGPKFRHKANMIDGNRRLLAFHSFNSRVDNGNKSISKFVDFLLNHGALSTITIAIAHNAGKYDLHLILEELYARCILPKLLMTGLKIYSAQISGSNRRKIIFKDSLNFMSGPLSGLYSTFQMDNVPGITMKPHFPHLFNKRKYLHMQLPTQPPLKYYGPREMKAPALKEFLTWYTANRNKPFLLSEALIDYCANDVRLLREACVRFRQVIVQICPEIEPFEVANTIAKLSLSIWRTKFLEPNRIISLEGPLNKRQRQSIAALKFFKFYANLTGKRVRTAEWSIGEYSPGDTGHRVDGLLDDGVTALEFHGCFYHGCPNCFHDRETKVAGGRTAGELYEATQKRKAMLERKGLRVIEIWGCAFRALLKKKKKLRALYDNECFVAPPLDPRIHGLRGGRVEPFTLFSACAPDEVIEHFDIVSLYPSVMKSDEYPVGEPILLTPEMLCPDWTCPAEVAPMADSMPYRGIMLVRVEPPAQMPNNLPPFLPYRSRGGNLLFPLCAHCAESKSLSACRHKSLKRSWVAAFPDADLRLALRLGYKILEIYEVWHWPEEAWRTGLFADYINAFLKLKVEASGWPKDVVTEEQKRDFVYTYMVKELLHLDPEKVELNKGLRHICKLLLNSLWGKLCQRPINSSVVITKSAKEFQSLMQDERLEIVDFVHLNKKIDRVVYRKKEEFGAAPETNALHIAVYVTSHARRRLFTCLREVVEKGLQLCYCDTDSVIYKRKLSQPAISEGQFLGEMTNELPGRKIDCFVACGPKNYAYQHSAADGTDTKLVLRVRGFELNYKARAQLTFRKMLKMVIKKYGSGRSDAPEFSSIRYVKFGRHKLGYVYTHRIVKRYRPVYEKGVVDRLLRCRPYGWAVESGEEE